MKFFLAIVFFALLSCKHGDSKLDSGAYTDGDHTYLYSFEKSNDVTNLVRFLCIGKKPYTAANCSENKELRSWDKIRSSVSEKLKQEIALTQKELQNLASLSSTADSNFKKIIIQETKDKNFILSTTKDELSQLDTVEKMLEVPTDSLIFNLNKIQGQYSGSLMNLFTGESTRLAPNVFLRVMAEFPAENSQVEWGKVSFDYLKAYGYQLVAKGEPYIAVPPLDLESIPAGSSFYTVQEIWHEKAERKIKKIVKVSKPVDEGVSLVFLNNQSSCTVGEPITFEVKQLENGTSFSGDVEDPNGHGLDDDDICHFELSYKRAGQNVVVKNSDDFIALFRGINQARNLVVVEMKS